MILTNEDISKLIVNHSQLMAQALYIPHSDYNYSMRSWNDLENYLGQNQTEVDAMLILGKSMEVKFEELIEGGFEFRSRFNALLLEKKSDAKLEMIGYAGGRAVCLKFQNLSFNGNGGNMKGIRSSPHKGSSCRLDFWDNEENSYIAIKK